MNISQEGLSLIKKFEGCELKAYRCPANVLTIGYGITKNVTENMEISQEEADEMLNEEITEYEEYVNNMVKVPLEQNQFDSLCAWVFNLGPTNLEKSTLLKFLNAGDYHLIPSQIRRWNKAGGETLTGLIRRREAESFMFEGKEWIEV